MSATLTLTLLTLMMFQISLGENKIDDGDDGVGGATADMTEVDL